MENSGSRRFITTFWRKPIHGNLKIVFYIVTAVCFFLIIVVPTYVSMTFYNNHIAERKLTDMLESGAESDQITKEVQVEFREYEQLREKMKEADPGSEEYQSLKESSDLLRLEIASKMPALVESYDEEGLPVLMSYKEYVESTVK